MILRITIHTQNSYFKVSVNEHNDLYKSPSKYFLGICQEYKILKTLKKYKRTESLKCILNNCFQICARYKFGKDEKYF